MAQLTTFDSKLFDTAEVTTGVSFPLDGGKGSISIEGMPADASLKGLADWLRSKGTVRAKWTPNDQLVETDSNGKRIKGGLSVRHNRRDVFVSAVQVADYLDSQIALNS